MKLSFYEKRTFMSTDFKVKNETEQGNRDSFETPPLFYAFIVLGLSLVPFVLNILGVDFASMSRESPFDVSQKPTSVLPYTMMFYHLTGCQWSSKIEPHGRAKLNHLG